MTEITADLENIPGPVVRLIILEYARLKGEFIGTLKYFETMETDPHRKKVIGERIKEVQEGRELFEGIKI
jgi:hypothetical protein